MCFVGGATLKKPTARVTSGVPGSRAAIGHERTACGRADPRTLTRGRSISANDAGQAPAPFPAAWLATPAQDRHTSRARHLWTPAIASDLLGWARSAMTMRRRRRRNSSRTVDGGLRGQPAAASARRPTRCLSAAPRGHRVQKWLLCGRSACSNFRRKSLTIDRQHVNAYEIEPRRARPLEDAFHAYGESQGVVGAWRLLHPLGCSGMDKSLNATVYWPLELARVCGIQHWWSSWASGSLWRHWRLVCYRRLRAMGAPSEAGCALTIRCSGRLRRPLSYIVRAYSNEIIPCSFDAAWASDNFFDCL